jgi:hypothetical protein
MGDIHDCPYHIFLRSITHQVNESLDEHYEWQLFDYWLGDDSNFGRIYRDCISLYFSEFLNTPLTQEQLNIIENKGRNLEQTISKWLQKWKRNHPTLPNEKMPLSCLKDKVGEYIAYQLKQRDIRQIVGNPC